jgi:hypothetical protein
MTTLTQTDRQTLDAIGLETGTDKNSAGHDYLATYARLFEPLRDEPVRMLEIGVWEGASLRTWPAFFTHPDARFLGVDVDLSRVRFSDALDNRAGAMYADANNESDLRAAVDELGGALDIVIDDGSHRIAQQRASFNYLRQFLTPGALYIVEDLHTHFWQRANPADAFQWLTDLAADIVGRGAERDNRTDSTPNGDLLSLAFYQSLAVFRKRG